MLLTVLDYLHNAVTLLFGVYISAAFLGIQLTRRNILTLFAFSSAVGVLYIISYLLFGADGTEKLYPLIVHIPLVLFLTLHYRYRPAPAVLSVLTAYLCCQLSNWSGLFALSVSGKEWIYYCVRIAVTVIVFVFLIIYVAEAAAQLLAKPTKAILILGLIPLVYYLFDYATEVYTGLLYSGIGAVVEFMGFMLCVAYLVFLFLYFKQYEEKRDAEQYNRLMEIQRAQSAKELEAIRRSEYAVSLLRHDMRHFLNNISGFIETGESEKALSYIKEIIKTADNTATRKYCSNEIVNVILSSYENQLSENGVRLDRSIQIPDKFSFSDVDFTSILSNALENAIHAVSRLEQSRRIITLGLRMNNGKLLMTLTNPCSGKTVLIDGSPQTTEAGHGLGTKSIRYVAEKLNGNCQFSLKDGENPGEKLFVLRVIL